MSKADVKRSSAVAALRAVLQRAWRLHQHRIHALTRMVRYITSVIKRYDVISNYYLFIFHTNSYCLALWMLVVNILK